MAQSGVYAPGPVIDADVTIRVNGVVREHVSMDWAGDTTGGLPAQVVSAGTGMRSRTGSILWAQEDVQAEPPHPLRQSGGWPPREGDPVVIDATVDTGQGPYTFRRFTGRLGRTTGSLVDGTLTSQITDSLGDALQEIVTVPPLAWYGGHNPSSWTVAYRAMEQAGLGHLPAPDRGTIIHYTGQGETTAVAGTLLDPGSVSGDHTYGLWARSPRLSPASSPARSDGGQRDVLVIARGARLWASWVQVRMSDGATVRMSMGTNGAMSVAVNGGQVWTGQWRGEGIPVLAFQFLTAGIRVWTGLDEYSTPIGTTLSRTSTVAEVSAVLVSGVSVRYPASGAAAPGVVAGMLPHPLGWRQSAMTMESTPATRGVENVSARSVIDQWGGATLTSVWMDEHGRTLVRPRDVLVSQPVARSVSISERVFAGSWSVGDDSVHSRVVVAGQQGALHWPRPGNLDDFRVTAWQDANPGNFDAVQVVERFVEAPSEVEWGPVDLTLARAGSQWVGGELNGSWVSAVVVFEGESIERWAQSNGVTYRVSVERLGQRTLKVTEWVDALPAGSTVYTRMASGNTNVHPALQGATTPIVRAMWTSTWADYTAVGRTTGPRWAPTFELDAGWWLTPGDAQKVADVLAAEVAAPMATLTGVEVLWDPTRQIGDVEDWVAHDKNGTESWRARVLVTGYAEGWDGRVPEQSVDVRVISWTDPIAGKTYDDLEKAYATYAGMATGTYQGVYDALPNTI